MTPQIVLACSEQSETNQLVLYLEQQKWQVNIARTGAEALALIKQEPDAAIIEVHLPDITGWDVLQQTRENPATFRLPVMLIYPPAPPDEHIFRGFRWGADCSLTTPVIPHEMISFLSRVVEARQ